MNVVTIPKSEYQKLQREQRHLRSEFSELRKMVQKVAGEELSPTAIKRLLGRSEKIDQGGGVKFASVADVKKYLQKM